MTRFIGNIRSRRYSTVEDECRRLLATWDTKIIPNGLVLEDEIKKDRPNNPPPEPRRPNTELRTGAVVDFHFVFDFDDDTLTPASKATLKSLVDAANYYFYENRTRRDAFIKITGHASREMVREPERAKKLRRQESHNLELSMRRAMRIHEGLRNSKVLGNLRIEWKGDTEPKGGGTIEAGNDTPAKREANRRVAVTAQ